MDSLVVRTDEACVGAASRGVAVLTLAHLLRVLTLALKLLHKHRGRADRVVFTISMHDILTGIERC